ncbi:MAG: DEAD/DEAH box helicase [Proteobacteria bacterium]|nr:DEAD/DEAH box helicase [Pseudomonadota bacterium]
MKFDDMGLNPKLMKAIQSLGFEEPTPIQAAAIPKIMDGQSDLVGLAQTGTGKTAAYGLPMLHLLEPGAMALQGLVLCPTRELCLQITEDLTQYARYMKNIQITAVYGGAAMAEQIRKIKQGSQIIVATPGRLLDLMKRKVTSFKHIRFVVLDEADEMFSMGFQEDINEILMVTPETRRTWLFSATMPSAAARIAKTYMNNPVEVTMGHRNISADHILHTCYVIREKDRYAALKRIIDFEPDIYALIFCRTRTETSAVAEKLVKEGYRAEAIHGDLSQEQRTRVMRKFREKSLQMLIATDVAARGIDVENISHVIHYNLPDEAERYTHRSGRTARAGKSGASMILVNTREAKRLKEIERRAGIRFTMGTLPQGREICEKQLLSMVNRVVAVSVNPDEIAPYLGPVYKLLGNLSPVELIQRFVSAEFNHFLEDYRNAPDLNAQAHYAGASEESGKTGKFGKPVRSEKSGKTGKFGKPVRSEESDKPGRYDKPGRSEKSILSEKSGPSGKFSSSEKPSKYKPIRDEQRFSMNIGRKDNINEGAIVRWVCEKTGISSDKIGQIHLQNEVAFFDVDKREAEKVSKKLKNVKLDDRAITIEWVSTDTAQEDPSKKRRERKK